MLASRSGWVGSPCRKGTRRGRPLALAVPTQRAILARRGRHWATAQLARRLRRPEYGGLAVAPSPIFRVLRRPGLQTRGERLAALESQSAQGAAPLAERTRRQASRLGGGSALQLGVVVDELAQARPVAVKVE